MLKGIVNKIERDRKIRAREHGKYLKSIVVPLLQKWMLNKGLKEAKFFNNDCLFVNMDGEYIHVEYSTQDHPNIFTDDEVKLLCEIIDRFQMRDLSDYAPMIIKVNSRNNTKQKIYGK